MLQSETLLNNSVAHPLNMDQNVTVQLLPPIQLHTEITLSMPFAYCPAAWSHMPRQIAKIALASWTLPLA